MRRGVRIPAWYLLLVLVLDTRVPPVGINPWFAGIRQPPEAGAAANELDRAPCQPQSVCPSVDGKPAISNVQFGIRHRNSQLPK